MNGDVPNNSAKTGLLRWCLLLLGLLFTALGAVGVFLPVLPTTPFMLLAAACFVRSSPALNQRLVENRLFGTYISQWQREKTVPRDAKRKAYGLVVVSFALSIALIDAVWLRWMLLVIGILLLIFLACLPTAPQVRDVDGE